MRAIVQDVYGSADVLRLRDLQPPSVKDTEVLVKVSASSVDPGVWHMMTGRPYLLRAVGFGLRRPKVALRGRALSGVVEAVGAAVTRFQPGDEVFGSSPSGCWAEYAAAPERLLAAKPAEVSHEQAAAAAISGVTALLAVRDSGEVRAGQRVLVFGAGGGVGSFAMQVARHLGAEVTAVCGPGKADLVRSLGATDVIDYTRSNGRRNEGDARYDVVIDTAGNRPLSVLRRLLVPRGTLVLVGGEHGGGRFLGGFDRQLRAPLVSLFVSQRLRALAVRENAAQLDQIAALLASGAVKAAIHHTYELSDAPSAMRAIAEGHATGKLVVRL